MHDEQKITITKKHFAFNNGGAKKVQMFDCSTCSRVLDGFE